MGGEPGRVDHGGMEPWVLPAVTVTFLVLFLALRNEVVRRKLFCPLKKDTAEVDVVQRYQNPTKPIRVKACNLLADPKRVDCGQACLHQPA